MDYTTEAWIILWNNTFKMEKSKSVGKIKKYRGKNRLYQRQRLHWNSSGECFQPKERENGNGNSVIPNAKEWFKTKSEMDGII